MAGSRKKKKSRRKTPENTTSRWLKCKQAGLLEHHRTGLGFFAGQAGATPKWMVDHIKTSAFYNFGVPPPTHISSPVMKEASSEHRNATTPATS
jgi:hypothetical protein